MTLIQKLQCEKYTDYKLDFHHTSFWGFEHVVISSSMFGNQTYTVYSMWDYKLPVTQLSLT